MGANVAEMVRKHLTQISPEAIEAAKKKVEENGYKKDKGVIGLDEGFLNLAHIKDVLQTAIDQGHFQKMPITKQGEIEEKLPEVINGLNQLTVGGDFVVNIVASIEELFVLVWESRVEFISEEVVNYQNKMDALKVQEVSIIRNADLIKEGLLKKDELEKIVSDFSDLKKEAEAKNILIKEAANSGVEGSKTIQVTQVEAQAKLALIKESSAAVESLLANTKLNNDNILKIQNSLSQTTEALKAEKIALEKEIEVLKKEIKSKTDDYAKQIQDYEKWAKSADDNHHILRQENETKYKVLFKTIEDLIPGATSVGLAESFGRRRRTYMIPRLAWVSASILALGAIVYVAILQGQNILEVTEWTQFGLIISRKLPVILPLIWIAYFGFHQFGILSRIEEEYAHKEVVSKAFEGYKKQLTEMKAEGATGLKFLIDNTLQSIGKLSAEAYDSKTKPAMPMDEVIGSFEKIAPVLEKLQGEKRDSLLTPKWALAGGSLVTAILLLLIGLAFKVYVVGK
jgi:predicted  nucleic acid-binding Zn-ribbon protein